jgi:hypothetical protein
MAYPLPLFTPSEKHRYSLYGGWVGPKPGLDPWVIQKYIAATAIRTPDGPAKTLFAPQAVLIRSCDAKSVGTACGVLLQSSPPTHLQDYTLTLLKTQ